MLDTLNDDPQVQASASAILWTTLLTPLYLARHSFILYRQSTMSSPLFNGTHPSTVFRPKTSTSVVMLYSIPKLCNIVINSTNKQLTSRRPSQLGHYYGKGPCLLVSNYMHQTAGVWSQMSQFTIWFIVQLLIDISMDQNFINYKNNLYLNSFIKIKRQLCSIYNDDG